MKPTNVCAILRNKQGDFLLQLRNIAPEKGKWVLFGGRVESGESQEAALKREIKEELNYEIKKMRYFKTYEHEVITPIFLVEDSVAEEQLTLNEGDAMRFFKPEELDNIQIGFNQKTVLADFLKEETK